MRSESMTFNIQLDELSIRTYKQKTDGFGGNPPPPPGKESPHIPITKPPTAKDRPQQHENSGSEAEIMQDDKNKRE